MFVALLQTEYIPPVHIIELLGEELLLKKLFAMFPDQDVITDLWEG